MGQKSDAWSDAATYAASIAGVEENVARDRGVPAERLNDMRAALRVVKAGDPEAFSVVVSEDYAAPAARAVAQLVAYRAEAEQEREAMEAAGMHVPIGDDDPTPVTP